MTGDGEADRFVLRRHDARTHRILNERYPPSDTRNLIAWVTESGDGSVHVEWSGALPLRTEYATAVAALDEIRRWKRKAPSGTKPIQIPHFPPRKPRRP